ncbi:hypothetical protein [Salinarimonas sp.]|uniref:hypothetical protein n=1 Tax=Salinarimonas sp. TaxID=2766526 RepID=UPI0039197A5B
MDEVEDRGRIVRVGRDRSLLLTVGKRREELRRVDDFARHRPVLAHYSQPLLDAYLLIAGIACFAAGIGAMLHVIAASSEAPMSLASLLVRVLLDVDDLVDVVVATMTLPGDRVNDAFNVAATEFTTLRDDFQAVLDAAGYGRRIVALPITATIGALRALEITGASPVYKRLIYKLSRDAYVSTERAQRRLGFEPRHSSRAAILRTFAWWRETSRSGALARKSGRTSREPWKQGALALAKCVFQSAARPDALRAGAGGG